MSIKPQRIETLEELRRLVPSVVKRANEDPAFGMRAACNPILALQELGLELSEDVRVEVEFLARFSPKDQPVARQASKKLRSIVGKGASLFQTQELEDLIRAKPDATKADREKTDAAKSLAAEIEKLVSRAKPLATAEAYEVLKKQPPQTNVTQIRYVLRQSPTSAKSGRKADSE